MAKKLYGTDPDQVPTNADLGTMAYQDAENPRLNNVVISGSPNDDAYGTLLRVKRGPSASGTWATVAIEAQTANGNSRIAFVNDIEPSAADAHGMIDFEHQTNRMQFFVDGSEAAHFNDSGNLVFPSGQGIDFSASEGSGASSSVLDDYEEGTWTPVLEGSSGTATSAVAIGHYTKVGGLVTVHCTLTWSANGSNANTSTRISGLPFTATTAANFRTSGAIGGVTGFADSDGLTLVIDFNTSFAFVLNREGTGYSHNNTISSSGAIYGIGISYRTDA